MSPKNPALKDKIKGKTPPPNGILEVTVQGRLGDAGISPQTITLTNQVHTVHWRLVGAAPGARLQIHFPQDPLGPFVDLEVEGPQRVSGYGNRGPGDSLKEYQYEARIVRRGGLTRVAGTGRVVNKATKKIKDPRRGGPGDPPPPEPVGGGEKQG